MIQSMYYVELWVAIVSFVPRFCGVQCNPNGSNCPEDINRSATGVVDCSVAFFVCVF